MTRHSSRETICAPMVVDALRPSLSPPLTSRRKSSQRRGKPRRYRANTIVPSCYDDQLFIPVVIDLPHFPRVLSSIFRKFFSWSSSLIPVNNARSYEGERKHGLFFLPPFSRSRRPHNQLGAKKSQIRIDAPFAVVQMKPLSLPLSLSL